MAPRPRSPSTGGIALKKNYGLWASEIRDLATGHGACFASDKITVASERVGYMYREAPDYPEDSGWRFMSGTESDAYMDNASNHGIYDVNTIANYDPEIIPFLDAPVGSAYIRDPLSGALRADTTS